MSSELSVAWTRGCLHYWHGLHPNEYEEGSTEWADWNEGWEYAVEEDEADQDLCEEQY